MKLTTTIAAIALTTSTAFATPYVEPPKEPPTATHDGGVVDAGAILLVLLGAVVVRAILTDKPAPTDGPRPLVRPQTCMNKFGVIVACEGE